MALIWGSTRRWQLEDTCEYFWKAARHLVPVHKRAEEIEACNPYPVNKSRRKNETQRRLVLWRSLGTPVQKGKKTFF